jgi:hypothetical protein
MAHQQGVSFVHLIGEVLVVGQELLVVHNALVQQHSCNLRGILWPRYALDQAEDRVSNEVVSLVTLHAVKLRHVNLRKSHLQLLRVASLRLGTTGWWLLPWLLWSTTHIWLILILKATTGVLATTSTLATSSLAVVEFVSVVPILLLVGSRLLHMLLLLHFLPKHYES